MRSRTYATVVSFFGGIGFAAMLFCSAAIADDGAPGYLPPSPDPISSPKLIPPAVLHKAATDPELAHAYRLLVGPRSNQGVELTKQLAEAGNPLAQTALCVIYRYGYNFPADNTASLPWCRRAADQGYSLGALEMVQTLRSIAKDDPSRDTEIVHWLREAAHQGIPIAYAILTRFYALGEHVTKDQEVARQLSPEGIRLQKTFSQSNTPGAAISLAEGGTMDCGELLDSQRYRYGLDVPRDEEHADALEQQSSDKGCWAAQLDLYVRSATQDPSLPKPSAYLHAQFLSARDREIAAAYGQPVASVINH